jgi:hypothetical protein
LDEAQDQGVLVRQGGEIGFRHPLLRTSVLACATSAEQRSAHRALAAARNWPDHSVRAKNADPHGFPKRLG